MLATTREWKNSFTLINRIPTDILSLIPTHLPSQKDIFHAASVCRHWRGVLLRNSALWSQLFLTEGEDEECVSTLLERAKGSGLDIITHHHAPANILLLIYSRAQQIRSLEFARNLWKDVETFSEAISGRLPLLRILKIRSHDPYASCLHLGVMSPASPPFFSGSTNLEQFIVHARILSPLSRFVFPHLTTFEVSARPLEECSASHLLEFLNPSPALERVKVKIFPSVVLEGVPQEMVVILSSQRQVLLPESNLRPYGTRLRYCSPHIVSPH